MDFLKPYGIIRRRKIPPFITLRKFVSVGRCIPRWRLHSGKKHAPLNSYVSLDEEPDNDGQIPLTEVLQSLTNGNPEDMVIDQENVEAFQKKN